MQKKWMLLCATLLLAACGTSNIDQAVKNAPSVAGSWRNLGSINGGNIIVSYDANSVRQSGNLAYLRDRKIVINMSKERFEDTPRYKVAVGDWEFNCRNRSYRLMALQFLDEKGKILSQNRYTSKQIPPQLIGRQDIASKQFDIVCS